jgi:ribosomal protein L19E
MKYQARKVKQKKYNKNSLKGIRQAKLSKNVIWLENIRQTKLIKQAARKDNSVDKMRFL